MTKDEAEKAMSEGKKVRHEDFADHEWVKEYDSQRYEFEDGHKPYKKYFWSYRTYESWQTGWSIVD